MLVGAMTDIVLGFYNQISHQPEWYQKRIESISSYGFNVLSSMPDGTQIKQVIRDTSINSIIQSAGQSRKARYLYLTAYGHRAVAPDLVESMVRFAEQKGSALLAHILDDDAERANRAFFSLHHQCFLLDLDRWRDIGSPQWGEPGYYQDVMLPLVNRSQENFHDNYTPLWVAPIESTRRYTGELKEGWCLLAAFLQEGQIVWNIDLDSRRKKAHVYPDVGELQEYFQDATTEVKQVSQKIYVDTMLSVMGQTFVFNNEPANRNLVGNRRVAAIYCVASGFKPLEYLYQRSFDVQTKICYFDYSASALGFKRWLVETWDGEDYLAAIERYKQIDPAFHTNWLGDKDYSGQWPMIQARFGGVLAWKDFWQRYRSLPHEYHLWDLFDAGDRQSLLNAMGSTADLGHHVLWYSNAWFSDFSRFRWDVDTLAAWHSHLHEQIRDHVSSMEIFGISPAGHWEEILYDKPNYH